MSHDPDRIRHSIAGSATLIADEQEKARKEAENGLRQFDAVKEQIASCLRAAEPSGSEFRQSCSCTESPWTE